MSTPRDLRLALDQNFPTPLINAVRLYLPAGIEVQSRREIDARLSDLDDRRLFLALHQLGWAGLIYRPRRPEDACSYFQTAAEHLNQPPDALWQQVGVSDDELARRVLPTG